MIIIGYQGIGKSTICKDNPRYIDFESSALKINGHRPDDWYIPYCQMAIWLSRQGYVVFTSSHKEVRGMLKGYGEQCIAIVPALELREEWCAKLKRRYEESRLEKDNLAFLNANSRYSENITEIMDDIPNTFLIHNMDYDLKQIVEWLVWNIQVNKNNKYFSDKTNKKTGKWVRRYCFQQWKCSECEYEIDGKTNYCPNCGADMR